MRLSRLSGSSILAPVVAPLAVGGANQVVRTSEDVVARLDGLVVDGGAFLAESAAKCAGDELLEVKLEATSGSVALNFDPDHYGISAVRRPDDGALLVRGTRAALAEALSGATLGHALRDLGAARTG